jgi:hypothetical protein
VVEGAFLLLLVVVVQVPLPLLLTACPLLPAAPSLSPLLNICLLLLLPTGHQARSLPLLLAVLLRCITTPNSTCSSRVGALPPFLLLNRYVSMRSREGGREGRKDDKNEDMMIYNQLL